MPFDPFFSSANKKHYVHVPGNEEIRDKVRAMSPEDKQKWYDEVNAKKHRTYAEMLALDDLRYYWNVQSHARRKIGAERVANDMNIVAGKFGVRVVSGYGGIGHVNTKPLGSNHDQRVHIPKRTLNRDIRPQQERLARYKNKKNRQSTI